jgi:acyl-homoserine-lactone acylase
MRTDLRWQLQLTFAILCLAPKLWCTDALSRSVTICRDNFGVPHIIGETEQAAFFGYGYAQAQDHLEQMMLQFKDAQGRRTEVLGEVALGEHLGFSLPDYRFGGDYLQRLLHSKEDVAKNKDKIDAGTYKILSAFARGVDEYISENRSRIPAWIDPITPEDIEALERSDYLRFYSIDSALRKLSKKPANPISFGSNQWAISAFRSEIGRTMHAGNLHMPWGGRFQLYEAHLIVPGKLNVGGASWFGSPFFLCGFNDRISWSVTWNQPNLSDVYVEKLNPNGSMEYLYENSWRPIRIEQAKFRVKTASGMQETTLPLYYTHHGPIVQFDRKAHLAYSIKIPNADGVNYSTGLYRLMTARNLLDFKTALGQQLIPLWNFLFSDETNIFWVHNALIARRPPGFDWSKPVPGWTKQTEWGTYLPFEDNPQLLNPPTGFLQNCNNPPWLATKNSSLDPLKPALYYLRDFPLGNEGETALNTRGERMFHVLSGTAKLSLNDMRSLAFDTYVMPTDTILPLLDQAYAGVFSSWPFRRDQRVSRALELLHAWDHSSAATSTAFTYLYFWGKAYESLYPDKFPRFIRYDRRSIDVHSWRERYRARRAFEAALDQIEKIFGRTEVPWGEINVTVRGGIFPMDGNGLYDVLHPDEGVPQSKGQIFDNNGWGYIMMAVEGQRKEIWTLLPYGESENPFSRHFNDQTGLHSRRELKQFWFSPQQIRSHCESVWGNPKRLARLHEAHAVEQHHL